jgi:hypothetical protein
MIDLDLVKVLRVAADEYEKVILRNRQLDQDINELRRKYNKEITEIRSNPSPKIHTATVIVDPVKLKQAETSPNADNSEVVLASAPNLSKRALTTLAKLKVVRVKDLKKLTLARIRAVKGCGVSTQFEIEDLAIRFGHHLK